MNTSSIPLVIDRLVYLLGETVDELADVKVLDGIPLKDTPAVFLAIADTFDSEWSREHIDLGAGDIDETYELNVYIQVLDDRKTAKAARDRAFEILGQLDVFIAQRQGELQDLGVFQASVQPQPGGYVSQPTAQGFRAYLSVAIALGTRFTP
jgi:hypothetical protein